MPKVDEIDLNGNSVPAETGQSETTETKVEEPKAEATQEAKAEESVDTLKAELEKVKEERENYKKGMLKYKNKTLEPEQPKEETKEEEYPDWDETSKKFQKQTITEAEKRAEAKAQSILEKANEKSAINQFISKYPELEDDARWSEVIGNYHPKHGKDLVGDIMKDLERAYYWTKFDKGEVSPDKDQKKAQSEVANKASVSKTTSKTVKDGNALSPGALKLASVMRVNPDKLALEDDSNIAEIKF